MDIRQALIVDDSKLVCFKLGKMLEEQGISSHAVNSGEDAITYLGQHPLPDVAFIDIMMPGMDGYQTIEAIRAQPTLAHLPIIMCSSNDTDEDRAEAVRRGANGFLPKPPAAQQLMQTLAGLSPMPVSVAAPAVTPEPPAAVAASSPLTAEVAERLRRETIAAAEQVVHTRMEDLARHLTLESEETARRVASTLAAETARKVAERVVTELSAQTVSDAVRQVASQTAREATHTLVPILVPEWLAERVPALAEQSVREAADRLAATLLQQVATPIAETAVRTALPEAVKEVAARLKEGLRTELAHDIPPTVAHAVATLIEGDKFRQALTRTVSGIAEGVANQSARAAAESVVHVAIEQALAQAAAKTSPSEQTTQVLAQRMETLTTQLHRAVAVLGAGLTLVVLYLVAKLFAV